MSCWDVLGWDVLSNGFVHCEDGGVNLSWESICSTFEGVEGSFLCLLVLLLNKPHFCRFIPRLCSFWEIQPLEDTVPACSGFRDRPSGCLKCKGVIPEQHLNFVG